MCEIISRDLSYLTKSTSVLSCLMCWTKYFCIVILIQVLLYCRACRAYPSTIVMSCLSKYFCTVVLTQNVIMLPTKILYERSLEIIILGLESEDNRNGVIDLFECCRIYNYVG